MRNCLLSVLLMAAVLAVVSVPACAFMGAKYTPSSSRMISSKISLAATSTSAPAHEETISRSSFLFKTATICTGAFFPIAGAPPAAVAADDASLKGTKKDPAYESCLSDCMFYCTKPKGMEQKSRAECLPECKVQCATTKEQLLKGTPLKK